MFKMKVRDFSVRDRHYVLGQIEEGFVAIEHKHIDKNGKLKIQLNGIQMHLSKTLEECMERTRQQVEVEHLIAQGVDTLEAIKAVIL